MPEDGSEGPPCLLKLADFFCAGVGCFMVVVGGMKYYDHYENLSLGQFVTNFYVRVPCPERMPPCRGPVLLSSRWCVGPASPSSLRAPALLSLSPRPCYSRALALAVHRAGPAGHGERTGLASLDPPVRFHCALHRPRFLLPLYRCVLHNRHHRRDQAGLRHTQRYRSAAPAHRRHHHAHHRHRLRVHAHLPVLPGLLQGREFPGRGRDQRHGQHSDEAAEALLRPCDARGLHAGDAPLPPTTHTQPHTGSSASFAELSMPPRAFYPPPPTPPRAPPLRCRRGARC